MNRILALTSSLFLAAAAWSSAQEPSAVAAPDVGSGNVQRAPEGRLEVTTQSPWYGGQEARFVPGPDQAPFHVRGADGELVRRNVRGEVTLPPGRYLIEVPGVSRHAERFWTTVHDGQVTSVDATRIPRK